MTRERRDRPGREARSPSSSGDGPARGRASTGDAASESRDDPSTSGAAGRINVPGYRISGVLGLGGFGKVWAATRESDGRAVAIKTVHREQAVVRERLEREAEALRVIGPPAVPELYERGRLDNGTPYFVCERIDIPSLDSYMGAPMALDPFLSLARPILQALIAVHEKDLLHRDLKPENIFVSREPPSAKLIDFGLTKLLSDSALVGVIAPTTSGMVLGTPLYMSPEQCEGRADIDHRADIYSLGVVFYQMLTGKPPFSGDPAEVRMAHVSQRPAPMARHVRVARALDDLIASCLAKLPERRPKDATALLRALESIAEAEAREPTSVEDEPRVLSDSGRQRSSSGHTVALLYFETQANTLEVQRALVAQGGRLASIQGQRCIAAFGVESRDNPIELALDAAEELIDQRHAWCVVVDRARARIHASPDGTKRIISSALYRKERFPVDTDPGGVLLTLAVESAAAGVRTTEVAERSELRRLLDRGAPEVLERVAPPIGREQVTRALFRAADTAFAESEAGVSVVLGDTGQGKSHLAAYLADELRRRTPEARIVEIRLGGARSRTGQRALIELARSTLLEMHSTRLLSHAPGVRSPAVSAEQGKDAMRELVGAALSDELWPALAATLGWLARDSPEFRRLEAAPAALRAQSARAVGEMLRHVARRAPIACLIDDAHLADETALDALEYATDASAGVPIWVCALVAPSFSHARPHFGRNAASLRVVRLERLDAHSAAELCRQMLLPAENIPKRIIARFVAETHHNPWMLTELASGIKRQNLIRRHERGESWYLAVDELESLPELPRVEWLIERELDVLPDDLVAHAGLMAVLAADISEIEVEGVLIELEHAGLGASFPLDAWVSTSRLIERGILVRDPDRGLGFRHEVLRERVARSLPSDMVHAVHTAAYRYYRDTDDVREERQLHLLAHHAAHCGHERAASAIYLSLAEWARQRYDGLSAAALYTRAIEILPEADPRVLMRAYGGRGLMHYQTGRFGDALSDLHRARALAEEQGDARTQIEFLLDEAMVLDWTQDFRASQELVARAVSLSQDLDTPFSTARLHLAQGRAQMRAGRPDNARPLLEKAVEEADSQGVAGYQSRVDALILLGEALISQRQYEAAEKKLRLALVACAEREDKLRQAMALDQRRELGVWRGQREAALADVLAARELGRELGQIVIEYVTGYHLAEVHAFVDEIDRALEVVHRAVELEPTSAKVPRARLLQARLYLLSGDFNQSRRITGEIRAAQKQSEAQGDNDALFGTQDAILLEALSLAARRAGVPLWRKLLARTDIALLTRIRVLETFAVVRAHVNDMRRACARLDEALALCADHSHLIANRLRTRRERYNRGSRNRR